MPCPATAVSRGFASATLNERRSLSMLSVMRRLVPAAIKRKVRSIVANSGRARMFDDLAPLIPPVERMFDGGQSLREFKANGEEFLGIYNEVCDLRPDETMLDVGCGIGRKTWPLTRYFDERAVYEGIDITAAGIEWCRARYTPRYPNFRFQQIDVHNRFYNPDGRFRPAEYRFPFADETFSFVMLGSVFTHMLPADLENYLTEVSRVLTKGGRCLITYFLLNEESTRLIEAGASSLDFRYVVGAYRTISTEVPEYAIAFAEGWIRALYPPRGLEVTRLDHGSWCGRERYLSYQDLILAVKQ
jgi:SAM-dependent methyltransferase